MTKGAAAAQLNEYLADISRACRGCSTPSRAPSCRSIGFRRRSSRGARRLLSGGPLDGSRPEFIISTSRHRRMAENGPQDADPSRAFPAIISRFRSRARPAPCPSTAVPAFPLMPKVGRFMRSGWRRAGVMTTIRYGSATNPICSGRCGWWSTALHHALEPRTGNRWP